MTMVYLVIWAFMVVLGLTAILALVWAVVTGQLQHFQRGATSIFDAGDGEERLGSVTDAFPGQPDAPGEPAADTAGLSEKARADQRLRRAIDRSCRDVCLLWFVSGMFWLLLGSVLAILASIKLHSPEFLGDTAWLTFGRVRPAHLNTVAYGWSSMTGIGVLLWLMARLCKVELPWRGLLMSAALYWNLLVAIGSWQILAGGGTSVEWLEFPWWTSLPIGAVFLLLIALTVRMLVTRREKHLYVSQWYLFGATIWFPVLYIAATLLVHFAGSIGVAKGLANWWYAHNVLGLWLTPIGLAAVYYLIPKVTGRPIHSYYLSILGFWTLAIFYNWVGSHHLVGGPLPAWVITIGTVSSMMMLVPVITVAVNHHLTMVGQFHRLRTSPTLRFTVFGAMSYTVVSVQGSLMALRTVNEITHFTHYTVAHAHLGLYAFYSMVLFGAMYYILPRLVEREWASVRLIQVHFWCTAVGIVLYFVGLSWGGWFQGRMLLNPDIPFMQIVRYTVPWLWSRSFAGILMTVGHLAFAILLWKMIRRDGAWLIGPTLFPSSRRSRSDVPAEVTA